MKKLLILFSILTAISLSETKAQDCFEELNLSLNLDGVALLEVESIVIGDINDYSDLSFEVLLFDCNQIGESTYELTGNYLGEAFDCSGKVTIEDKLEPIAICGNRQPVFSPGFDTIWLEPLYIDENSYDNCTIESFKIDPEFITRDDIGIPVQATLTITDASENVNVCSSTLTAEEGPAQMLQCNDKLTVKIGTQPYPIVKEELLSIPESEIGPNLILTLQDASGNLVKNNLVTQDYIGQELDYTISDMYTNSICWGKVEVLCASILICDEESACTDVGDCESGHSESDHVEWPCDLDLIVPYNGSLDEVANLLTEDYLTNVLGREPIGTIVTIDGFPTQCITISYNDESIPVTETRLKIIRTWILLDFVSGIPYDYIQLLDVEITPTVNLGDWPVDIEVDDIRIHPEELIRISHISPYEAYPDIGFSTTYEDHLVSDTGGKLEVERTWTAFNGGDSVGSHIQRITANYSDLITTVSVQGSYFSGIEDVSVNNLESTDESGLAFTEVVPAAFTLEATLDKRINIRDLKALQRRLLNLESFNTHQIISGDFDESGMLSSIDYLLMKETVLGELTYESNSSFQDKELEQSFPVYAENKILVELGDVVQESICPAYFDHSSAELTLNIDSKQVKPSGKDCVFMYASGYDEISSFQVVLAYDPNVILVTDVKEYSAPGSFANNVMVPGEVRIAGFYDTAHTAHPCIPLMEICYDIVGEVGQSTDLSFVLDDPITVTDITVADENGITTPLELMLMGGTISIVDEPEVISKPYKLVAEDRLLNAGQSYSVDFYLEDFQETTDGIQVKMEIGQAIEFESLIIESLQDIELDYFITSEGDLSILMETEISEVLFDFVSDDPLFTMSFDAAENSLLSSSCSPIGKYSTFISDASRSIYLLDVEISNAFTTHVYELGEDILEVAPNPVTDYLTLHLEGYNGLSQNLKVSIRNVNGLEVLSQFGLSQISTEQLPTGVYIIQVHDGNRFYSSKFSKFQ